MRKQNITIDFLEEIEGVFQKPIPEKVLKRAKLSLLDYVGVTWAGTKALDKKLTRYLKENPSEGDITAIGLEKKLDLMNAVFLNGLNAHALDFDDGTNMGIIHLGSPIFSVLLPLAQKYKVDSKKFFEAAVKGYEASFTMAVSIQPKHKILGFHATGTCGVLGIAVAVSHLLNFNREQARNAFAIAAVSSSGMLKVLDDGSELKPYNVAKTALLGLTSIQMAYAGFVGHPDVLSGDRGFLSMMAGSSAIELKKPLLNGTYAIEKTYTKPYAACRYCHPAIEAAKQIQEKYSLDIRTIKSVQVSTYYWAVAGHDHVVIPSTSSAKMSIPYSVAVALIFKKAGLKEYEQSYVENKDVVNLMKKIHVYEVNEFTEAFPQKTIAEVIVTLEDKTQFIEKVDFPKGEPENPLSEGEFKERFLELALYSGKNAQRAEEVYSYIKDIDGKIEGLFGLL